MDKFKIRISTFLKWTMVFLGAILILSGCGKASPSTISNPHAASQGSGGEGLSGGDSSSAAEGDAMADSAARSEPGAASALPSAEEGEVLYFSYYNGEKYSISHKDTSVSITLHSKREMQQLPKLTWVKELKLAGSSSCPIADLECIKNLTQLEVLDIRYEDITDISILSEFKNLKDLNLIGNKIEDISPLADLGNLEELRLQSNRIADLSPLSNLKELSFLGLDGNPIRDITPLSGLSKDTYLCLSGLNFAWDDWEPVKHIETVIGRPPVENAGTMPCPVEWIDRLHEAYPEGLILSLDYDDYDGNGTYEAFAFVSADLEPVTEDSGVEGTFLMVTQNSIQELYSSEELEVGGYYRFGSTKVVFLEDYDGFTSSTSYIWTAEGDNPRSMNLSGWGQWFYTDEFGNVCVLHSTYDGASDGAGHSYKPYFFYFDGYDFVEYGAIPITTKDFLKCRGAQEIWAEIEEEGLTIAGILYRGNDMIHVNLREYQMDAFDVSQDNKMGGEEEEDSVLYYYNEYKTFRLSDDGQLTLTDSDMGVYHEYKTGTGGTWRGIDHKTVPVEYPSGFPLP